ncbi:MAG: hypothetical protein HUJ68_04530 [Clostridia bacterium]|nr:hypothetical protein [Clostridia bacterium]
MAKKITYKCKHCGKTISREVEGKPDFNIICECGEKASRYFGDIGTDKPIDSVSGATQMMLFSKDQSRTIV